jgi:hypothetical protein
VPFDFLKRKQAPAEAEPAPSATEPPPEPVGDGAVFDGITEEWRLTGRMVIGGRVTDALNRREPVAITDVLWAPVDGSEPLAPAPGLKSVDPYDLILVMAGDDSLPETVEERDAHRIHKVSYEVALDVPPYRVVGTVHLYPGFEPDSLLRRSNEMFFAVANATVSGEEGPLSGTDEGTAILVNRQYLRGVRQVDARTGEPHERLPGAPLGGVNWTDRA